MIEALEKRAPYVGCLAALLGTFLASVAFFPSQPALIGALVVPGIVLSLGILLVPILRLLLGSDRLLNSENFVAAGFLMWLLLDLIQGAYDLHGATDHGIRMALVSIGVFAACMWLATALRPLPVPKAVLDVANEPLDASVVGRIVPICFILGMFNFLYSVDFDVAAAFSYLGAQRWAAPWSRGQLGGWEAFRDQMPYFGYVLPSLAAVLIAKRGLLKFQSLLAIAMSIVMLLFLSQGGGRRIIGVTVGSALLVWVLLNTGARVKNIIVVGVGAIALAWAAQLMLNVRTSGYEDFLRRGSGYDYLHIDDNFLRLAQIIDLVPQQRPYVYSQQVLFTLVRPVPRVLWPNKPVNPGFDLAAEVGLKGVSLSSSILGEWYISWGWWAIVVGGFLHGILAKTVNSLPRFGNPIVYGLATMVLVAGMRSMLDLVIMSYALIAFWAVSRFYARKSPRYATA
jgi:oligosaccharide repeat unit polymerase